MHTTIERDKRTIALLAQRPGQERREELATLQEMADADCWFIIDIRLLERPRAHEYSGSAMAEDFCASYMPGSEEEGQFIQSMLREFTLDEQGTILWCTYQNMWRGQKDVDGYTPPTSGIAPEVYFSFQDGLKIFDAIKAYWDSYEGDIADARIENPNRQPRETEVRHAWLIHRHLKQKGRDEREVDSSPEGGLP